MPEIYEVDSDKVTLHEPITKRFILEAFIITFLAIVGAFVLIYVLAGYSILQPNNSSNLNEDLVAVCQALPPNCP